MKNPVMALCSLIQLGASLWAAAHGNGRLAILYLSFAVGSATVSTLG